MMMAKNRADRYSTFDALIQDLEALARGDPPLHARRCDQSELLGQLAVTGQPVPKEPPAAGPNQEPTPPSIPLPWFIAVVILTGVSLILNVIQCIGR